MTVKQIETATVVGTIGPTGAGNATVVITARDLSTSPETVSVAVANNDTASQVAEKIRVALVYDSTIAAVFLISGTGADVVLTKHVAAANDTTLNISIANGTCTGLTAAPTSTATLAGTGLSYGYCTLAEMKASDVLNLSNTDHDVILETVIEGVSRAIDNWTGRRFYSLSETRYYTSVLSDTLYVDDISTATGCTIYTDDDGDRTYENTWASTDYDLLPLNAETGGFPFTMIETTPNGNYTFPGTKKGVKITAAFGWASIPAPINRACVLQATRLFKRYITPLGVSASTAVGQITLRIPSLDHDICGMISPYQVL
jgi:hypothetical protein